ARPLARAEDDGGLCAEQQHLDARPRAPAGLSRRALPRRAGRAGGDAGSAARLSGYLRCQAPCERRRIGGTVNLHRFDLFTLALFSLLARTGSISKGSELAGLALGAASKRIADLEAAVGVELFERHSRGVTLTEAGRALQHHAQRILGDFDQLSADLSDYARG